MIGMMLAAEYFKNTEIELRARQLLESINWGNYWFDPCYCERMMAFLESAGQPRDDRRTANDINAWNNAYWQGNYGAAIYWHQWQNLWYDGRNTQTTQGTQVGRNDFNADQQLTLELRKSQQDMWKYLPDWYNTYDWDAWGITAASQTNSCYGVNGWILPTNNSTDAAAMNGQAGFCGTNESRSYGGNLNPFATVASLPFAPTEVLNAMRHMFWRFGPTSEGGLGYPQYMGGPITSTYGFAQTYNIGDQPDGSLLYRATGNAGFDNGPQIMAIENYRTGLIWNYMMQSDYMKRAMWRFKMQGFSDSPALPMNTVTGIPGAVHASNSTASPTDWDGYGPPQSSGKAMYAFDLDKMKRWHAMKADADTGNVTLSVTFPNGSEQTVGSVILWWHDEYATAYDIRVKSTSDTWHTYYTTTSGDGTVDRLTFSPPIANARAVEIVMKTRVNATLGYSIWEVEIYPDVLVATGALVDDFEVTSGKNRLGGSMDHWPSGTTYANHAYARDNYYAGSKGMWIWYDVRAGNPSGEAGYWTQVANYDARNYKYLSLWAKGSTGTENFRVRLKTELTPGNFVEDAGDTTFTASTTWTQVIIPLVVYDASNLADLDNINVYFHNNYGGK